MKAPCVIVWLMGLCTLIRSDTSQEQIRSDTSQEQIRSDTSQEQMRCRQDMGAEANRRFAYEFFAKAVSSAGAQDNVFLAPTTVAKALAMVLAGAGGRTKKQIWNGLMFPQSSTRITEDDLACIFETQQQGSGDKTMELYEASQVFGERSVEFALQFIHKAVRYGVPVLPLDFFNEPKASREIINKFIASVTRNKITDLFSEDDITANTILAITSAIYFKGMWKTEFDPLDTREQHFRINENKAVMTDFMRATMVTKMSYSMKLDATLLELPYKSDATGKYDVSMVIVQPETSMDYLREKITEEHLSPEMLDLFQSQDTTVKLSMPKFKMTRDYELTTLLMNMGMTDMFDATVANLTGMVALKSADQPNLYVSSAVHKTFIAVDEKGTEASAATGITILARTRIPSIELDRQFIFIIYEKKAQKILFIGRLSDPTTN